MIICTKFRKCASPSWFFPALSSSSVYPRLESKIFSQKSHTILISRKAQFGLIYNIFAHKKLQTLSRKCENGPPLASLTSLCFCSWFGRITMGGVYLCPNLANLLLWWGGGGIIIYCAGGLGPPSQQEEGIFKHDIFINIC